MATLTDLPALFDGALDLRERRFVLDEAPLRAANTELTTAEVDEVRRIVASGRTVRIDPRLPALRRSPVRLAATIVAVIGVLGLVVAVATGHPWGILVGLDVAALGVAALVLSALPGRPALPGVVVREQTLGSGWADRQLRTALADARLVLGSRAIADGWLDSPAVTLSLTDQLVDLRLRTELIGDLERDIAALPRAQRKDLTAQLDVAKAAVKDRVRMIGTYADRVRQLDAHLRRLADVDAERALRGKLDDLTAKAAADPYRADELNHHVDDARAALAAARDGEETAPGPTAADITAAARTLAGTIVGGLVDLAASTRAQREDLASLLRDASERLHR